MGLGLYLHGAALEPRDALLEQMESYVEKNHAGVLRGSRVGENDRGHRALWLSLHPAEEDVELSVMGKKKVIAAARTSGAGPGYHAFVCDLLDELAEHHALRWQAVDPTDETGDETGYFHHRDRKKLETEMVGWLRAVARSLASGPEDAWKDLAISMPASVPTFEVLGAATALGPRDLTFWKRVIDDEKVARGFFPWWEPGTGAGYLLGRALCLMWSDVRWRVSTNDAERKVHDEVLAALEEAWALDRERPYPFAEWAELLRMRGDWLPDDAAEREQGEPSIGYRRGHLRARPFPGASVRIPGSFSEKVDPRRGWCAFGNGRTVWVSLQSGLRRSGVKLPEDQPEPKCDELDEGGMRVHRVMGKRVFVEGDEVRTLAVSILFTEPHDSSWALETWHSVRFQ
ncbi:MAG: hypothetical protein IPJ65_21140 [Archangiaceae bacterium]|nr:hypothetical protein [Archangiaceae bacterium]